MWRLALLISCLALVPVRAFAQEAADTDALYTQAREAFAAESYEDAMRLFREVLSKTDSPNARLYVARSLMKLGKLPEAYDEMARTLRDASARAKTEARFAATRDAAIKELEALESQVGRVTVEAPGAPDDAKVTLDGTPLARDAWGSARGVEPGVHTVVAAATGRGTVRRAVTVRMGGVERVVLELPKPAGLGTRGTPTPSDTAPSGLLIGGIVVAGVGAVGMVVFGVLGSMAKGKLDDLEAACGQGPCSDPSLNETVDEGERLQTGANVGLALGLIGLAAGGTMIVLGSLGVGDSEQAATLSVTPLAAGAFVGGALRF